MTPQYRWHPVDAPKNLKWFPPDVNQILKIKTHFVVIFGNKTDYPVMLTAATYILMFAFLWLEFHIYHF